ncbi:serine/arginine repetitive matrix protein 2-like isoform X1 [Dermacentor albipictus]|uniref:serine/arginine repetitive matrix protein 2-like isoform X1 n=1 Tax=Dermacentor albipictus TaxID=60249 RepID=UPI0031FCC8DD
MDEHSDESQSQESYVTSPTKAPRQRQRSPDERRDRRVEAEDVAEDQEYLLDVDASSKRPRHEREYSPVAQGYDEGRDGSPIPTSVCMNIVERQRDTTPDDGEETRATRASETRAEGDQIPAAISEARDVPRRREPRETATIKDVRARAPASWAPNYEFSTSSSSSELRPIDLPPMGKRQLAARPERSVERRKSSKASVGGTSTASGRLPASTVSASRSRSRVSRASYKATGSDATAPPPDGRPSDTAPRTAGPGPSKTTTSLKDPTRADSTVKTPRHLRQPSRSAVSHSNISRKSITKQASQRSISAGAAGRKPQPSAEPNVAEASRVSTASGKRQTPGKAPALAYRDERGSAISADRRSLASKASADSRRSRASTGRPGDQSGGSKKTSDGPPGPRHQRHQHPDWQGNLDAQRDTSAASMLPLAGDSRLSAKSSQRSLRPIGPEEVPLDKMVEEKPKGKFLVMPDGTYVRLQEKNVWIRAMQEKYLAIDYKACSIKVGFGLMLIGFIYIIMFRQDILLNMAIFVRDYVYDPDTDAQSKEKYKHDNKTSPEQGSLRLFTRKFSFVRHFNSSLAWTRHFDAKNLPAQPRAQ